MKLIAYLIITFSIVVGSLASSTAYLTALEKTPIETLQTLRLNSPAGSYTVPTERDEAFEEFMRKLEAARVLLDAERKPVSNPLKPEESARTPAPVPRVVTAPTGEQILRLQETEPPIGRAGDLLIPQLVELLIDNDVTYVKTSSFSFRRWPHSWMFALACIGLLGGAWLVRYAQKLDLQASEAAAEGASVENATDARTVFARLSGRLNALGDDLARATTEDEKLEAIVRRIGFIQRDDVPAFVADRPALVNRLGLGGYAELMDNFAAMERQLNRAWSAAADGHLPESETCLRNAQPMVVETLRKLKG
jgi:hypothetical protein